MLGSVQGPAWQRLGTIIEEGLFARWMYPWIRRWELDVRDGGISRRLEKTIRWLVEGSITRAICRISKEQSLVEYSCWRSQWARGIDMYGHRIAC